MAGNGTGGPWGNGGGNRGSGNNGGGGDRPPSSGGQGPDLDDLVRKGQEQLRILMGGKGGDNKNASPNGGGSGSGSSIVTVHANKRSYVHSFHN